MKSYRRMNMTILLALVTCLAGVVFTTLALQGHVNAVTNNNSKSLNITLLTPNQIAAGGPIPQNHTLAQHEAECVAAENNPPWSKTLLGFEHHDYNDSKIFDCATFTGSSTSPNSVYAYKSPDTYYTPAYMTTLGINEMYVYGGSDFNANPAPIGSYVARVEPGSLKELWRTNLVNFNISGAWEGAGGIAAIGNDLIVIDSNYLYKLDPTTGAIKHVLTLPTGASPPKDSYFNGFNAWPDGTLVMKNLARAPGCTIPGLSAATLCPNKNQVPPSTLTAVDSKTFKILDSVQLPQMIGGRPTVSVYHGKDYAYFAGSSNIYRYEWNGKNLTLDKSWNVSSYLLPGQTQGSGPAIMGDWIILSTNTQPTNASLSVIAISQANSSRLTRIEPMPLKPGEVSYIPTNLTADNENNRIYAMDPGPGKVVALNFNPKTGNMTLAWSVDQNTGEFLTLLGPANHRVMVGTNVLPHVANSVNQVPGPKGVNYKEQVQWRDPASGKLLAASDYFSPAPVYGELYVGYGGLIYDGLNDAGHLMALKVLPASSNSTSTSTSPTQNSTSTTSAGG